MYAARSLFQTPNHESILSTILCTPLNRKSQHQFSYITVSNHNQEKRLQELMQMITYHGEMV